MHRPATIAFALLLAGSSGSARAQTRNDAPQPPDVRAAVARDAVAVEAADLASPRRPTSRRSLQGDPYDLLSADELLDQLEQLTSIRPHLGWRHSTSSGEAEAFDWIEASLSELGFLASLGLEIEREDFRTFTGVEFWETSVTLRRDGVDFVAPADGAPGHRDWIQYALRFDSDGFLNDRERDPLVAGGRPLVVRTADEIYGLPTDLVSGRVVLLDYAAIDRSIMDISESITRAWTLIEKRPAAVVMVTTFSNADGVSHGSFAGDLSAYTWVDVEPGIPVLSLRMEDLEPFGIRIWDDLADLDRAIVRWDVDLFAPGESSYMVARIPGRDSSRAVILGAHIDSPNSPGAFDNGSGSVAVLEVARVLDRARVMPPVDLYLTWFGSHERGLYGSSNFTARREDILDRAIAMLQMDCLGHPLDGIANDIWLETWSYQVYGDDRIPWPGYLLGRAYEHHIDARLADVHGLVSDNSSFAGYGVPNVNMIFMNPLEPVEVHYGNHLHDPYDAIDLARMEGEAFADMATILLAAALETGVDDPDLRVAPPPDRRAVFVGSHTEGVHMSPAGLTGFGMALTWEGFDVDMVPYGEPVTDAQLADADLVVALPVHDYPSPDYDTSIYDEAWTTAEIDALERYVLDGGLLVLTNTDHRLKYINIPFDGNEDWPDVNELARRFGVRYMAGTLSRSEATPTGGHPLVSGVSSIQMIPDNGHRVLIEAGEVIATANGATAVALVPHGSGEVVVLTDLGMLGASQDPPPNRVFWRNLARYAR
jgi:hypothetical protein